MFTPLEFPGVGVFAVNITDGKDITITYSDGGVIEDLPSEVENEYNFVNPFQDYLGAFKTPWTSNLIELHLEREVFLYIWATTSDSAAAEISGANSTGLSTLPREWTGVFCEPRYWSQAVKATVEMEAGVIKDIERLGEREAYDAPHKSGFARFVHQGQIPEGEFSGPAGPEGFGDLTRQFPTVDPQLVKRFGKSLEVDDGFADEGTSLVFVSDAASIPAFSLYGRTNGSLAGLLDPLELAKMYSDAFKLLFAFSVTLELTNHNASTPVSVSREFRTWAFAINGVWSRATQAGLGFLGVLALCLVVLGWSRRSNLDGEPNNLAAAMGMLARSQALTRDLYNSEYHDPAALKKILRKSKRRYRLQLVPGQGPQVDVIEEWVDIKADHNRLLPPAPTPAGDADPYKSAPSWPLSWWSGVVFFSFFAVLLVGLVFVFIYDRRNNGRLPQLRRCHNANVSLGLPTLLSTGSFGYKLLYSYLPTILGTAVEPLLVTLGSYYCMVGPYKILHRRRAGAPTSLALLMDYDKSPPHFQLLRSLKARDVELGALTIALILANVLAVSFAGLFSLTFEEMVVQTEVARYSVPSVVAEFQQPAADVYYALDGAFTGAVPPPNWTTTEYYVLPFNSIEYDTTQQLESTTVGFGADITCELVPKSEIIVPCDPYSRKNGGCIAIKPFLDVELSDVWNASGVMPGYECWGSPVQKPFQWQSGPNANFIEQSCAEYFFIGWVEFPVDTNSTSPEWPYGFLTEEPDTVMLNCSSTVKVAGMTAMVDEARNVVSMDNIQPMDQQAVENLMGVNGTAGLIRSFVKSLEIASTSFDSSHMIPWFGSLMSTIDPSLIRQNQRNVTILPNTTNIVGAFEDVYKRVFAASLRQYADDIFDTRKPRDSIPGTATVVQARVRVSVPMFGIATGILIYFLVLILYLYLGPPAGDHGISHLPTTLATAYTLLYASNAREELSGIHGEGQEERAKKLKEMRNSYGFGGFVGLDKRQHFGVYRKSD